MGSQPIKPAWWDLLAVAEPQHGLLRRDDLLALGLHPRQIRRRVLDGRLHRLHPGIYALGRSSVTRRAEFVAAVWWCGDGAALSHRSAAAFHGWIAEDADHPPPIHVTTTMNVASRPGIVEVHRTRHLDRRDVLSHGLLRVTDHARTLVDLADGHSYAQLREVADQLPALPTQRLIATAARLPGRHGAGRTQRLIHSEDARTRSALERRHVAYCARHDLPQPDARNVRVGGLRVDCLHRAAGLVIELDSRAHHTRRKEMADDRRRDRALRRAGLDVLRLVWEDLEPDDPLAAQDTLARLGASVVPEV